jgi:flavodoxin
MNVILYATTSGSTEAVVLALARLIGAESTQLLNLRTATFAGVEPPNWVFAGTPTYGKGDWHYLWMLRHRETAELLRRARHVALFGLGDSIHHGPTFAGGIGHLHRFCREIGVTTLGATGETVRASPSVENGRFPGLVIEYARDRRRLDSMLTAWLTGITYPSLATAHLGSHGA